MFNSLKFFLRILILIFNLNRPEVKENKEGADTEKAAEQDKNESEKELAKDKVRIS